MAKLEFIQDTISERQNEVMHLTEAKVNEIVSFFIILV